MPTKLKVFVGVSAALIVLSLLTGSWVSAVLHSLLLIGVLRGNDGVRTLLIGLAFLSVCAQAVVLAIAGMLLMNGLALAAVIAVGVAACGAASATSTIWYLHRHGTLLHLDVPEADGWARRAHLTIAHAPPGAAWTKKPNPLTPCGVYAAAACNRRRSADNLSRT